MTVTKTTAAAVLVLSCAWWYWRTTSPADEVSQLDAIDQLQGSADDFAGSLLESLNPTDTDMADTNTRAFLAMIRASEGTAGVNGYRTLFGGSLFNSFDDHPRQAKQFTDGAGRRLWTSAAGAYQFMAVSPLPGGGSTKVDTWDRLAKKLGLQDFTPASQDVAAVQLIKECGALYDVAAGRFDTALTKCRKVWASLPGAGYAQHENSRDKLAAIYTAQGGTIA